MFKETVSTITLTSEEREAVEKGFDVIDQLYSLMDDEGVLDLCGNDYDVDDVHNVFYFFRDLFNHSPNPIVMKSEA